MMVYVAPRPWPSCKHCGRRMEYFVPGMRPQDHSHPACAAKADVERALREHPIGAITIREEPSDG